MKRVVITGLGIVSCIGNDPETVTNNLKNLNSGISFAPEYEEFSFRSLVHGKPSINLEDNIDRRIERFQNKDPNKSLEDIYADQPRIIKLIDELRNNREFYERNIQFAKNTSSYKSVSLSRKIDDDQEMLTYVTDILQQCEAVTKVKGKKNLMKKNPEFEKNFKKGLKSG